MYIFIHPFFDQQIQIKYSRTELVNRIEDIQHPIVREILGKFKIKSIDINSIADIPAGTGLGSSCSFTVGLLHALYAYICKYPSKEKLAREACEIEVEMLKEPIGKQDQYSAAYGGLNLITFYPNESVNVEPIIMPLQKLREFERNLVFFYTGMPRPARNILNDQRNNILEDNGTFGSLVRMAKLAQTMRDALSRGNLQDVGLLLDENWRLKKTLSKKISECQIDSYYETGKKNGALGGKLLGAGGGGFLMFYCEKEQQEKLARALSHLRQFKFGFDNFGTKVIYVGENGDD
jgi:D-glycero-alpha-D-manno-heptose-7-phosphate kinase